MTKHLQCCVGLALLGALALAACKPKHAPAATFGETGGTAGDSVRAEAGTRTGHAGSPAAGGGGATAAGAESAGTPSEAGASNHGGAGGPGAAGGVSPVGGRPTGGNAGSAGADRCGNGRLDGGERCDGDLLRDETCVSQGFDAGSLTCSASCDFDTSDCSGTEDCFDGRDNDGDGTRDCGDSDCEDACASLCSAAPTLSDPSTVSGDTTGHTSATSASCAESPGSTGREVVYRIVAAEDGVLEASLYSADAELTVSFRTVCEESSSEQACAYGTTVRLPVVEGDEVYVLVDGATAQDDGAFELTVGTVVVECGNGTVEPGEQCDDGGTEPDDGCDATCQIESSEGRRNDTANQADSYVDPYVGAVDPEGDTDYVVVNVTAAGSTIETWTEDLGDDACANGGLDSALEIYGSDGETLLAEDDDGGTDLCSQAVASDLEPGNYYVRVFASPNGDTPQFPYILRVTVTPP